MCAPGHSNLADLKLVRLNTVLFPVSEYEGHSYQDHGIDLIETEASSTDEILAVARDCHGLAVVSAAVGSAVIDRLTHCRIISRIGAGTDKIDVDAATRQGILVTNVPDFCIPEQSDHTMALLLSLARKMPQMSRAVAEGAWVWGRRIAQTNRRLADCVLGLVGFGKTGQAVALRARAFGMRVLATRRNMSSPDQVAEALGVAMMPLDSLLAESDYVSLHLPLNKQTYHLLNDNALRKMKPSACLINTSRGALVDEMALAAMLREGRLQGAGIDTFEHIDPFSNVSGAVDHPLLHLDNVVLTPHVASHSVQSAREVGSTSVENVAAVFDGHWPNSKNVVNYDVVPRAPLVACQP